MPGDLVVDVTLDDAESRYIGTLGGQEVAEIDFRLDGQTMIISHTRTDPALRGNGIAAQITRFALDDARARKLAVRPDCPYTADFMATRPEYADLHA